MASLSHERYKSEIKNICNQAIHENTSQDYGRQDSHEDNKAIIDYHHEEEKKRSSDSDSHNDVILKNLIK